MKRILVPDWAPRHARHVTTTKGDLGETAKVSISPLLPEIYNELERRVNAFANDSEQCFCEADAFPFRDRLDGKYYIGSECFEGNSEDDSFRLWVQVRCSEKPWHPNQIRDGYDYLGLEAIVTVERDGSNFTFDEGFNTSSI